MNVLKVFTQSCLSVKLFAAQVTHQCVLTVVIKHVRSKLSVLNKFLAAYQTFVIFSSSVSSNVPVECLLSGKAIVAHRTTVWSLACVYTTKRESSD